MTHPLLRPKRAMDAVNQELLRPTEDPRKEEAQYLNPWFGKGTEYNPDKQAKAKRKEYEMRVCRFRGSIRRKQEIRMRTAEGPAYHYIGRCVGLNGDSIGAMVDEAQPVSFREISKNCSGVPEWLKQMGYGRGTGLAITKDWHVGFGKSRYQGVPCYYIDHSSIEYVWTLKGERGAPAEDQDEDEPDPTRLASKRAIIKMHEDTKVLPPRNDMRSYLDDDIKKEMEEDEEEPVPVVRPPARRHRR